MPYNLKELQEIIVPAGTEELLPRFARVERALKADGSILTEADLAVQVRVAGQLQERWPETGFLGEEMTADEQQAILSSDQPVWCLDPLDGTRNFAAGIPYFCISLALLQDGAVYSASSMTRCATKCSRPAANRARCSMVNPFRSPRPASN